MARGRRLSLASTTLLVAVGLAAPAGAAPAGAADLVLTRVMLSTGGVAYVEYAGEARSDTPIGLDVRLDQVDDVLKSLILFDDAGGVGGFELPGRDGQAAAFGDLPFGADGLDSPLAYLNSLRGVMLTVTGPRPMTGRLLHAQTVAVPSATPENAPAATRTRVSLMAEDGLRQFVLEDEDAVEVADPALRARIAAALDAIRSEAASTTRHITLHAGATSPGPHPIRVGYVAGAPLWKTTYRLVLPPQGAGKARLQGWAVLENTTGADWNGVELSLQYGNPVTFRQALYQSYFVDRPLVPVEILGRILPGIDTRATAEAEAVPPPPMQMKAAGAMPRLMMAAPAPAPAPTMAAPSEQAAASEGVAETVFRLPTPIVLAAGHTASVPILDREVAAARIGLVQFNRPHPLAAIRITNDSAISLPAGVLTLYDPASPATFAGDARLGGLPAGESRLLSFAEDLRSAAVWRSDTATGIVGVTASGGVLHLDERVRWTDRITLSAPANAAGDFLVEIPRRPGAAPATDNAAKPLEQTDAVWRYPVSLAPGETKVIAIAQERVTRQEIALLQDDTAVVRLVARGDLAPPAKQALSHLIDLRQRRAARVADQSRLDAQAKRLDTDEKRIRDNLAVVPAGDALHTRLVRQLDAAETRIEALQTQISQADAAANQAQQDLVAAIGGLSL